MIPFAWELVWEPLYRLAGELGMPISFHLAGGIWGRRPGVPTAPGPEQTLPMQLDEVLAGMLCSGILDRNSETKIVLAEAGLGWIPYLLERLDAKQKQGQFLKGNPTPRSEIFRRQVYVIFEEDKVGLQLAALTGIGVENYMWGSDFPHPDSTFPHSRSAVEEMFAGMPPELRENVTSRNVTRLYRL
jgi:predicted TIM-barrel fold metal-dependent hydrolase